MTKTISVKELRMNFPKIVKELGKGTKFTIIYRSKPIAELTAIETYSSPFKEQIQDGNRYLPKTMKEFLENIDKYSMKFGKKTNAVDLIRKDRGYYD